MTYLYTCMVLLSSQRQSAAPLSGISSVTDGFHLAQQDFICRQANFIARVSDNLLLKRICRTAHVLITYALDLEGWAVGVAALWGGHTTSDDER